ncbi:MAG: Gfo/Idh/MocA family oxidoreductase [Cyclobacteriaceae bacterium]|nr:Gfo/Idh/MocA family oxidoreductase [Cyclobacteriaceae bacterium]
MKTSGGGLGMGMIMHTGMASTGRPLKVGIIGLDTSHSPAFVKIINDPQATADVSGFRVVSAYPYGSRKIESSYSRIPGYTEEVVKYGVKISDSLESLIDASDVIMLETNDGHPHLEQAMAVIKAGKPMFIDKPVAASLKDVLTIYREAASHKVPVFSSSSLRYIKGANELREGQDKVVGANAWSPAHIEPSHPDLFWYGIHGIEILFTVLGKGCIKVSRFHENDTDVVVGTWSDGRIGVFRGGRSYRIGYGGTAFLQNETIALGPYEGYKPLVLEVLNFFRTGQSPVSADETIEIYAFMEAADESKRRGGAEVTLQEIIQKSL